MPTAFILGNSDSLNGMKLRRGSSDWKRFCTKRLVGHWNKIPREAVMAPSLSEVKEHLDDALAIWFSFRQSHEEQGVGLDDAYGFLST